MLKKMVDGVEVECSPEEEAEIRAEWANNKAKDAAINSDSQAKQQALESVRQSVISNPSGTVKNSDLKTLLDLLGV